MHVEDSEPWLADGRCSINVSCTILFPHPASVLFSYRTSELWLCPSILTEHINQTADRPGPDTGCIQIIHSVQCEAELKNWTQLIPQIIPIPRLSSICFFFFSQEKCSIEQRNWEEHWPGRNVTSLLHEGSQWEPQTVEYPKLIGLVTGCLVPPFLKLFTVPFIGAEAADQEKDDAHSNVGKHDAHPNLISQRVEEGEDPWLGLLWLFYHDGDPQTHKWLGEVYHLFPDQGDR